MAATQLDIYNDVLMLCGERFLSSLTENREPRRLLDQVWASGGVRYILERGQWNFAMRTQQLDYDSGVEPSFGYRYAFDKPTDYCCTCATCSDEYFRTPLIQIVDEGGYWYSDTPTIYVRFVSDDLNYGMNLNKWPETFKEVVVAHFASKIILKLSGGEQEKMRLEAERDKKLKEAKNSTAMQSPTVFPPQGAWIRARTRNSGRSDGGNSGSLIG